MSGAPQGPLRVPVEALTARGVEVLPRPGGAVTLPRHSVFEAPCSLKWAQVEGSLELGAFSYQVSGFVCAARIGRYCSFGEQVQIGRQDHPTGWVSTSPYFYLGGRMFGLGEDGFAGADRFGATRFPIRNGPATRAKITHIGHDVWIGHGAYVRAGVRIGTGAIVAAHAVVARDVPPYAVVAGNPATVRKLRLPEPLAARMLASEWWRFAPWQLDHLDPSDPAAFCDGVAALTAAGTEPAALDVIDLRTDTVGPDPAAEPPAGGG